MNLEQQWLFFHPVKADTPFGSYRQAAHSSYTVPVAPILEEWQRKAAAGVNVNRLAVRYSC
jgi:hypothetical protein